MKLNTIVLLLCAIICMASCSQNRGENSDLSDEEEACAHQSYISSHLANSVSVRLNC